MDRPAQLIIPALHAGNTALIAWSTVQDATGYQLDRRVNDETDFTPIYGGPETSYTDFLPEGATSATYRVQAAAERDDTWDDLDAADRTWDDLDALDWMWVLGYSDYTVSDTREVIPNRPPVISGQDGDMGVYFRGFPVVFSATDPDPGNTVDIVVRLDNDILFSMPTIQQGANYTTTVTDEQIFAMEHLSVHTITITATDNKGATSIRTYTFTAAEDLVSTAVFYVLRDGAPVARLGNAREWTDYLEVGTHRYVVRGIDRYDNFSDSNEVTVTITVDHATLATASAPGDYITLSLRRNERPQVDDGHSLQYTQTQYEGREYPVYGFTGQRGGTMQLAFSTRTLPEQSALRTLVSRAEPLVYRDTYNTRMIGVIPGLDRAFQGRFVGHTYDAYIDYSVTLDRCDFDEVVPYD